MEVLRKTWEVAMLQCVANAHRRMRLTICSNIGQNLSFPQDLPVIFYNYCHL